MSDPGSRTRRSPSAEDRSEPPRKKVRKGTRSCWECKRRKIRCMFAAPADSICEGCRRRGTTCISQEFPDEPAGSGGRQWAVEDRLGRVEALVETLVGQLVKNTGGDGNRISPGRSCFTTRDDLPRLPPTSSHGRGFLTGFSSPPRPLAPALAVSCVQDSRVPVPAKYEELSKRLAAAWPSQRDLDLLLSVRARASEFLLYKSACVPPSNCPSPREALQLPPSGSHPLFAARKLLSLAIFLQGFLSGAESNHSTSVGSSVYREIVSHAVEAAGLVTSNDELANSVEGIECIMMESMYYDTAGNLCRAWLAIRRAMTMAQMMGFHRGTSGNSPRPQTGIPLDHIWFRLVQADRYISLMLGLPQGSTDSIFAAPKTLDSCTPIDRLRRLHCLAAGRILQSTHADVGDPELTCEMDKLLQKASATMPSHWWLAPGLALSRRGEEDETVDGLNLDETMRFMDQFVHYHLLTRLHLPYLLCSSDSGKHDYTYSRITAISASRETLIRFVSFRSICPTVSYCRGVDFLAFIASSTLCLAHIEACRQRRAFVDDADGGAHDNDINFLIHQRLSDRGLMERALAMMENFASATTDETASNMAAILRYLLAIHDDAANGGSYHTSYCPSSARHGANEAGAIDVGRLSDDGNTLEVYISHIGTIVITKLFVHEAVNYTDEWALDGVDTALEGIVDGLNEPDTVSEEPWTRWASS